MEVYGTLKDGREAKIFTLTNRNGMEVKITEYGAILVAVLVPDRDGIVKDLVHGFDELTAWQDNEPYFGATVGRVANRVAKGCFTLDGKTHELATNNEPAGSPCHLHGGEEGFDQKLWTGEPIEQGVRLTYVSPDGEEGYPGELSVTVTYLLNDDNELTWQAEATTTAATPVNLVNHSYWNLSGDPTTSINDHELTIHASHFLPCTPDLIPTGEHRPVEGTPLDFRTATVIGDRVNEPYEPLVIASGYDHAFVIDGEGLRLAAKATDPKTGRTLEVTTDQPAVQFYGANFLDGTSKGKDGVAYARRSAFCLETELFPDSPNQENFPNSILRPGETYRHTQIFKFSW